MRSTSFSGPADAPIPSVIASRVGQGLSTLVVLILLADGLIQLFAPRLLQADMAAIGFSIELAPTLGLITLACALLYAVPRTAIVGATLLTGFLGGAIAMHFRIGELGSPPQLISLAIGAMAWTGLYLRDNRVRQLFA